MATLVKIRGLDRPRSTTAGASGAASSADSPVMARGFRLPASVGTASTSKFSPAGVKASRTSGSSNAALTVTANEGGTYGNSITFRVVAQSGTAGRSVVIDYPTAGSSAVRITLNPATTGGSIDAGETAALMVGYLNNSAASHLITASLGASTGATVIAADAGGTLANGTDVAPLSDPLYLRLTEAFTVVVDMDDARVAKLLRRNAGRFISLGQQ
jgi:hypothetical protein